MRIVSYGAAGQERPGVLLDDERLLDVQDASASMASSWRQILAAGQLDAVRQLAAQARSGAAGVRSRAGVRLGPPVCDPSKIVCIGLNYADHAAEQGKPLPETPLLFAKAPTALVGDGDAILLPALEPRVDIEAELAFVVGRLARHVRPEHAMEYVAGYMCFNDVSGRLAQFDDKQWFRGKSFDTFAPCGPWMVTRDEIDDPHALAIGSRVDDFVLQESHTSRLVHRVPELVAYISRSMTLLPGDIVATGTPAGVGVFRQPPRFLQAGQHVSVTIEKLGTLSNPVMAGS